MTRYRITQNENGIDTAVCSVPETVAMKTYNNLYKSIEGRLEPYYGVRKEEMADGFKWIISILRNGYPEIYTITLKVEEE